MPAWQPQLRAATVRQGHDQMHAALNAVAFIRPGDAFLERIQRIHALKINFKPLACMFGRVGVN